MIAITAKEKKEIEAIQRIKDNLHCSEEEARNVYQYDMAVEKGEKTEHDLPPDKLKIAQKYTHTGTRKVPMTLKLERRAVKPNETKSEIIAQLAAFLPTISLPVDDVIITNSERQISFSVNGSAFELTLVQKRKSKK